MHYAMNYCYNDISGDVSLGRYNKNPRMRVQKAENANKALEFITSRGVKLTNIGPEGTICSLPICSHAHRILALRYHRRKPEAHSWDDMDSDSTIHYSGHQVYFAILSYDEIK